MSSVRQLVYAPWLPNIQYYHKSLVHGCLQTFDGAKGRNASKNVTHHMVRAEGLHHDPNQATTSPTLAKGWCKEGLSFMTWANVYLENLLIKFLFASWYALNLPRRESGVCSGINHFPFGSE